MRNILFSVNTYDQDGDCTDTGIYLHFDDIRIKVAKDLGEFKQVIETLQQIENEIVKNH